MTNTTRYNFKALSMALLLTLPAVTACNATSKDALKGDHKSSAQPVVEVSSDLTHCPEPRPELCSQQYTPVCAQKSDGTFANYPNGCTACTDPAVVSYRDGDCP